MSYEEYRSLMFGCRTARRTSADHDLWHLHRVELEDWLRARELAVRREVDEETDSEEWNRYRDRAVHELAQSGEFWRDKFDVRDEPAGRR